jgi:hypothetical protein
MTRERYSQWIEVWKWFQTQRGSEALENLYGMLNAMWQQDRAGCSPDQLAEYDLDSRYLD